MSETATVPEDHLKVLDGIVLEGAINTSDDMLRANVAHAIRLGHPQVWTQPPQVDRVCIVGGGPSLDDPEVASELRELIFDGAKVVTVNGAYRWCIDRNIRPSAQIVLDARPGNARFVNPAIPQCRYLLASQCHADTWREVSGRPNVWIWHAAGPDSDIKDMLDDFYSKNWTPIAGGTTVAMRAITLLRALGFLRMDLFGADSCAIRDRHHAYDQPENDGDVLRPFHVHPTGHPELGRTFWCAGWHIKQLEDFLQTVRVNGDQFLLNVHGAGLLAYALRSSADIEWAEASAAHSSGEE